MFDSRLFCIIYAVLFISCFIISITLRWNYMIF